MRSIRAFHPDLIKIRHQIHQNPELGFEEVKTAELVARELASYGIEEIHRGLGVTGVVAVIEGQATGDAAANGRVVGLRADMDALPMQEANEFAHRSKKQGVMHGCGHDGHTAMLLGAARHLAQNRDFPGRVVLIFQPGEEGHAGARAMIRDGLFERFPCDAVFAMHNWPGLPAGQIAVRPGPAMAAADRLTINITGKGGHGAHPYLAVDPVVVSAHIITAVQSIVSRNVSPLDSAVVSLCSMQAGDPLAMSVIPSGARLIGTVRTFRAEVQDQVEARIKHLAQSVAAGFDAIAEVNYERVYPATINSRDEALFAARVASGLVGPENLLSDLEPSMGAEDFSFMLQQRPGAYLRIGQGGAAGGCFLHNTRYDFNDDILPLGAGLMVELGRTYLSEGV
ncbi:MAG: M20 aminoacylase family protein [Burkholderiaceae bacterium]